MSFIVLFGIPGFRDPVMPQIRDKVTAFFAYMQIFLQFFCTIQKFFVSLHSLFNSSCLTGIYRQIRLTRENRERIGSGSSRERKGRETC